MIRKPVRKTANNLKRLRGYALEWIPYFETHSKLDCYKYYLTNDHVTEYMYIDMGLAMDGFESLIKAYNKIHGRDAHSHVRMEIALDSVDDPWIIGNALFCQWRYLGHWAYNGYDEFHPELFLKMFRKIAGV